MRRRNAAADSPRSTARIAARPRPNPRAIARPKPGSRSIAHRHSHQRRIRQCRICGMLLAIFTSFCTSIVGSILIFGSMQRRLAFGGTICCVRKLRRRTLRHRSRSTLSATATHLLQPSAEPAAEPKAPSPASPSPAPQTEPSLQQPRDQQNQQTRKSQPQIAVAVGSLLRPHPVDDRNRLRLQHQRRQLLPERRHPECCPTERRRFPLL